MVVAVDDRSGGFDPHDRNLTPCLLAQPERS